MDKCEYQNWPRCWCQSLRRFHQVSFKIGPRWRHGPTRPESKLSLKLSEIIGWNLESPNDDQIQADQDKENNEAIIEVKTRVRV